MHLENVGFLDTYKKILKSYLNELIISNTLTVSRERVENNTDNVFVCSISLNI